MKHRIIWIDWAKTILIYLMVVGHCNPTPVQAEIFYAFHMPAFFVISGMLFHVQSIGRILKSIIIPIVIISLINVIIFSFPKVLKNTFDVSVLFHNWWLQYITADSRANLCLFGGVWFVVALLICRLCMNYLVNLPKSLLWVLIGVSAVFMCVEPSLPVSATFRNSYLWRVIPSLPFMILGYLVKNLFEKFEHQGYMKYVFLLIPVFFILCFYNGRCDMFGNIYGKSYFLFLIDAVIGSCIIFSACCFCPRNKYVETISKGTLLILGMNMFFRNISGLVFDKLGLDSIMGGQIYPWFHAIGVLLLAYFPITLILQKCPIILGK